MREGHETKSITKIIIIIIFFFFLVNFSMTLRRDRGWGGGGGILRRAFLNRDIFTSQRVQGPKEV